MQIIMVLGVVAMILCVYTNIFMVDGYRQVQSKPWMTNKNCHQRNQQRMSPLQAEVKERSRYKASPDISGQRLLLESFLVDRSFLFMETLDGVVADPVISLLSLHENGDVVLSGAGVNRDEGRHVRGEWSINEIDNRLNFNVERTYTGKYLDYNVRSSFTGEIIQSKDAGSMMYIRGTIREDDAESPGKFVMMPTSSTFNSLVGIRGIKEMLLAL